MKYELKLPLKIEIEFDNNDCGNDFTQEELQSALNEHINRLPDSFYEKYPADLKDMMLAIDKFFYSTCSYPLLISLVWRIFEPKVGEEETREIARKYFHYRTQVSIDK
jgi:hypothetical protein